MLKRLINFIFLFSLFILGYPQEEIWNNYYSGFNPVTSAIYNNTLWVGTIDGVNKTNLQTKDSQYFTPENSSLVLSNITTLDVDIDGSIWLGSWSVQGIQHFNENECELIEFINDTVDVGFIYYVYVDDIGIKWFGTDLGLLKFDNENWEIFNSSNSGLPNNNVNCIKKDNNNNYWMATFGGLVKYDGFNWTTFAESNSEILGNDVSFIDIEENGTIWIIFYNDGELQTFDGLSWEIPAFDAFYNSLCIDNNNTKWFATLDEGLVKFNNQSFESYNTENSSIPSNTIYTVIPYENTVWLSSFYPEFNYEFKTGRIISFNGIDWDILL